jgi:hypothetical protein
MSPHPSALLTISLGVFTLVVPTALLYLSVTYLFAVPLFAGLVIVVWGVVMLRSPAESRQVRYGFAAALLLAVAAIGGPIGLCFYASSSGKPIRIIVPQEFVGEVKIVLDAQQGDDVTPEGDWYVYRVPPGGTLRVKSLAPFFWWHSEEVVYPDGRSAKVGSSYSQAGSRTTATGSEGDMYTDGAMVVFTIDP